MMPTVSPSTFLTSYFLLGFHGQHKDAISQIKDKGLRRHIHAAFEIQPHDVIFNGGAYLGFGDLRIAPLNFKGRILAIEAAKHCFDLLQQNISSNGAGNVLPIHCALWNVRELRSLGVSSFQANTLVPRETRTRANAEAVNATQFETIEAIPIDDLVDLYAIARVDFANLTLNGAEVEAVEGMKDTLSQYKHRLRLAGWYVRARPIRKICQTFLNKFSYRVIVGGRGNVFGLPKQFLKLLLITTLSQPPTFLISVQ